MNESTGIVLKVELQEAWMITTFVLTAALRAQQDGNVKDFNLFKDLADKVRHQLEFQQK